MSATMRERYAAALAQIGHDHGDSIDMVIAVCSAYEKRNIEAETNIAREWKNVLPPFLTWPKSRAAERAKRAK